MLWPKEIEETTSSLQVFGLFIVVFFPTIALVVVSLRIYSRARIGQFGWDDGLIIVASFLSTFETFVTWGYIKTNFVGIHVDDIPKHDPTYGMKFNYAVQVLYNPIIALVKNSVLIFLLRLAGNRKSVKQSIWALVALNTALMLAIFIVVIFQCTPIQYNWNLTIEGGHCVQQGAFYVSTSTVTLFTDILVLALPFWIVMGLKMTRKMKFAVIGIFFLGGIVTLIGIVRLILIVRAFFYPPSKDYTYTIGFTTSAMETNIAVITASVPAMKPLFKRWFPRLFSSASASGYIDQYGNSTGGKKYGRKSAKPSHSLKHKSASRSGLAPFELKNMRGLTEIQSSNRGDSEEEIMTYDGIVKTTNVSVRYASYAEDYEEAEMGKPTSENQGYNSTSRVVSM